MFPEQSPASTQARHDGADRYRKNLRDFLVGKLLDVHKQDNGTELRWNPVERAQDFTVRDFLCHALRLNEISFEEFLVLLQQRKTKPLAALMAHAVEQNLVKPCPAIRARFEPVERTPGL